MNYVLDFLANSWLPASLTIAVFAASSLIRFIAYHTMRRFAPTQASYVATTLQFAAVIGGLYGTATYFGINPVILLSIIAIFTAGVSLAADGAIGNAIAGAVILASAKFSVNEQATIAGVTGIITSIGVSSVTIQSNGIGMVTIPNSAIVGGNIVNHSRLKNIEQVLQLPFHDSHSHALAEATIRKVLASEKLEAKVLHNWSPAGEEWAVIAKVPYDKRREIMSKLSIAVTEALIEEGMPLGAVSYFRRV